jgi:hypothetical protein
MNGGNKSWTSTYSHNGWMSGSGLSRIGSPGSGLGVWEEPHPKGGCPPMRRQFVDVQDLSYGQNAAVPCDRTRFVTTGQTPIIEVDSHTAGHQLH